MLGTIEPDAAPDRAVAERRARPRPRASLGALWTASGYVGAFGRAMNRIYEIAEGRPFWKLRPIMLLHHRRGPGADGRGAAHARRLRAGRGVHRQRHRARRRGGHDVAVSRSGRSWRIAVVLIVAMLYYATPNVKQPKFRWISVGALVAIVVWVLASVAFAFYVANFSSYNKTYGSLAGVIVALLLPVADQPRAAVRRRGRLRARARPAAPGRHRRRGGAPAPRARHPQHPQGARRRRPRTSPRDDASASSTTDTPPHDPHHARPAQRGT